MKAVVNGIELEGSPAEISAYVESQTAAPVPQPPRVRSAIVSEVEPWMADLIQSLTATQRETYLAVAEPSSRHGISTSALSTKLHISRAAATQRCRVLEKLGLIERVSKGRYRRID